MQPLGTGPTMGVPDTKSNPLLGAQAKKLGVASVLFLNSCRACGFDSAEILASLDEHGHLDTSGKPAALKAITSPRFEWELFDNLARAKNGVGITSITLTAGSPKAIEKFIEVGVWSLPDIEKLTLVNASTSLQHALGMTTHNAQGQTVGIEFTQVEVPLIQNQRDILKGRIAQVSVPELLDAYKRDYDNDELRGRLGFLAHPDDKGQGNIYPCTLMAAQPDFEVFNQKAGLVVYIDAGKPETFGCNPSHLKRLHDFGDYLYTLPARPDPKEKHPELWLPLEEIPKGATIPPRSAPSLMPSVKNSPYECRDVRGFNCLGSGVEPLWLKAVGLTESRVISENRPIGNWQDLGEWADAEKRSTKDLYVPVRLEHPVRPPDEQDTKKAPAPTKPMDVTAGLPVSPRLDRFGPASDQRDTDVARGSTIEEISSRLERLTGIPSMRDTKNLPTSRIPDTKTPVTIPTASSLDAQPTTTSLGRREFQRSSFAKASVPDFFNAYRSDYSNDQLRGRPCFLAHPDHEGGGEICAGMLLAKQEEFAPLGQRAELIIYLSGADPAAAGCNPSDLTPLRPVTPGAGKDYLYSLPVKPGPKGGQPELWVLKNETPKGASIPSRSAPSLMKLVKDAPETYKQVRAFDCTSTPTPLTLKSADSQGASVTTEDGQSRSEWLMGLYVPTPMSVSAK